MARLPVLSARDVLRLLRSCGFQAVGRKGSHIRCKGEWGGRMRVVIVPAHAELAPGTLRSIIRQAGMEVDEFLRLLDP